MMEYHRAQIRAHLGFRECSVTDAEKLTEWLAANVCEAERRPELVRDELLARCRAGRIEPPAAGRVDRMVRSALHQAEQALTARIVDRLSAEAAGRLRALVAVDLPDDGSESVLALVKSVPGNVSLDSMLTEIRKLRAVRAVGLPAGCGARADKRVTAELVNAFKRVTGKENMLFAIAEASLQAPDEPVRQVVFSAVSGGEQTLRELVHEFKTKGPVYRRTVQTTLRASYTGHDRRGLIELLDVVEFRSNNATHRPVLDALTLIRRHADARLTYYPAGAIVPTRKGLLGDWTPLVFTDGGKAGGRVVRSVYEICTFQALREQLRCKEIWVVGAEKWRNPDEDLPADLEARRVEHYAALRKPLDASAYITGLQAEMRAELAALDAALPKLAWLEVADRGAKGPIRLTDLEAAPEPRNLRRLKAEVRTRWGTVPLIDMMKEAVLRTGCLAGVTAAAGRGDLPGDVLAERLLLAIYAYGTNTSIRAIAGGAHGHSEDDIRYVRRRYLTPGVARTIAVEIANATFAARAQAVWGAGSTAIASDSTHFGAFDQNIFTEWHSRYGGAACSSTGTSSARAWPSTPS